MRKSIIALINLLPLSLFANPLNLNCTALLNYEKLSAAAVTINDMQTNQRWGEYQQFRFLISRKANQIELQLFDGAEPSRTYASSDFKTTNFVELTIWKNEFLLTLKCQKP